MISKQNGKRESNTTEGQLYEILVQPTANLERKKGSVRNLGKRTQLRTTHSDFRTYCPPIPELATQRKKRVIRELVDWSVHITSVP